MGQSQTTFKVEFEEGYIWSPQRNNNGSNNESYNNLTKTSIGDTIFSYADGKIKAVGKIAAPVRAQERPEKFGTTGHQWDKKGWLVYVRWTLLKTPFIPKYHLADIVPLLPPKHAPIQANGNGNQAIYLAGISDLLGNKILSLINQSNIGVLDDLDDIDLVIEDKVLDDEVRRGEITTTEKQQIIRARVGQGLFRENVEKLESRCRITGITDKRLLIASHIKPWKDSTNIERLDGHNGLLLSPHIDKLFDKGWISFTDTGSILVSSQKILPVLKMWHIDPNASAGKFSEKQLRYLEHHQNKVFKG